MGREGLDRLWNKLVVSFSLSFFNFDTKRKDQMPVDKKKKKMEGQVQITSFFFILKHTTPPHNLVQDTLKIGKTDRMMKIRPSLTPPLNTPLWVIVFA